MYYTTPTNFLAHHMHRNETALIVAGIFCEIHFTFTEDDDSNYT